MKSSGYGFRKWDSSWIVYIICCLMLICAVYQKYSRNGYGYVYTGDHSYIQLNFISSWIFNKGFCIKFICIHCLSLTLYVIDRIRKLRKKPVFILRPSYVTLQILQFEKENLDKRKRRNHRQFICSVHVGLSDRVGFFGWNNVKSLFILVPLPKTLFAATGLRVELVAL